MQIDFSGTGVALVTPFINGKVDFDSLENVIEHTIQGGVDYLVTLGTTGESVTLSAKEKLEILNFTRKINAGRVGLVAGFGGNDTAKVMQSIKAFDFDGFDGILSVSPAYNKPTQEGIFQHFMQIGAIAPKPVILYNVPGRTSSNMEAETTLRLAEANPIFCAIKEASGNLPQCMELVKHRPNNFKVISGDDILTLPMLSFGMDGVISVIANGLPSPFSEMVRLGLAGDFVAARKNHLDLIEIIDLIFKDGNPAGIKGILEMKGICSKEVRLPLVPLTDLTYIKLKEAVKQLESHRVEV